MNKPISGVAFDLDDTLYPEREFVLGGYRAVAKAVSDSHGIDIFELLRERFLSGERGDLFTPCLKQAGCYGGETQVLELVKTYREHQPSLRPYGDVRPALERVRGKVPLCLISDGWAAVQRRKLAALDLECYFDVVLITDELGREYWKPHPRAFREAASRLGRNTEEMIYIGDNPLKDFCTARSLGMSTIRVRRPETIYGAIEPAQGYEADLEVSTLAEAVGEVLPRLKGGY